MGNKVAYELEQLAPKVEAGYSGNPLDPAQARINKALGRYGAIPPFFIPRREEIITQVYDASEIMDDYMSVGVVHSQMPMTLYAMNSQERFLLPFEPLVSVSGKNVIARRKVAKAKESGTIKERWSRDDYEVTIHGVLTSEDRRKYPSGYMRKLLDLFQQRQAVEVEQAVLAVFGIRFLAIESVNFPHTKGLENQNYEIKAYSDTPINLLIGL